MSKSFHETTIGFHSVCPFCSRAVLVEWMVTPEQPRGGWHWSEHKTTPTRPYGAFRCARSGYVWVPA